MHAYDYIVFASMHGIFFTKQAWLLPNSYLTMQACAGVGNSTNGIFLVKPIGYGRAASVWGGAQRPRVRFWTLEKSPISYGPREMAEGGGRSGV